MYNLILEKILDMPVSYSMFKYKNLNPNHSIIRPQNPKRSNGSFVNHVTEKKRALQLFLPILSQNCQKFKNICQKSQKSFQNKSHH